MSEITKKPIEAMSHREKDIYYGEWKDVSDERKEFAKEFGEVELIEGIYNFVSNMLTMMKDSGIIWAAECLVCHTSKFKAARFVAQEFNLSIYGDTRIGIDEFFITKKNTIEKLCISRQFKNEGLKRFGAA